MPEPPQPSTDLPTQFQPVAVEGQLYERWVKAGYFEADAGSDKPPFCIVIPPPNVTGSLHIGHALDHTLMDALTRRRRMQGYEVLWLPGMDHAGIATQNMVERELAKEGKSRHDLGRDAFVSKVWEWKARYGGAILNQMRRLGDGVDWSRERFTMDEGLSRAVLTIFKRLYDDGLIYRAERIINWCPRCMTALSDIEVDHAEIEGELTSVRYGSGDASIVVATTRPETILGDTAVAVHPDDERYRHLVGTEVELPLTDRRIPIVADRHVDPDFGTGAVKVTPAHDPNDFEIGKRHNLAMITIMDERGAITAHGPFQGLDRFEARPAVVRALHEEGRVLAVKRPHLHAVGHCSRCDTVVEPRLSLQWFVRVESLAEQAGAAVRDGRVRIQPPELAKRYFDWVDNMHDWCISRQLWWGHRIPVWYGPDGETICVGPNDEPPTGAGWRQDEDVLDTWFSSGLWPFSTLGWPEDTADLRFFYPTSVLVTGYDILFFWVVRMMLFGLYAMDGKQPFDTVMLHGLVRDEFGKKMSKSRGNSVDPIEWMDRYGSDALRFTLARGANGGADQAISEEWCAGSRNFCNKLWNVTRFALLNGATASAALPDSAELSTVDRWVLSRLHDVLSAVDRYLDDYQFGRAVELLYHFVWDDFCDWYVELAKAPLAAGGRDAERTRAVLGHTLDRLLRVLHPVIPFVTETLWTALTGAESVVIADWPAPDLSYRDTAAEQAVTAMQRVVTEVRRFRADQGIRPGTRVPARLSLVDTAGPLAELLPEVRALARLADPADPFTATATLAGVDAQVELDTSAAIDVTVERARLTKDLAAAEDERHQAQVRLGNPSFVERAPAAVVDKMRARLATAEADVARIGARLEALPR
jgi:valyl-tRNA synthetase